MVTTHVGLTPKSELSFDGAKNPDRRWTGLVVEAQVPYPITLPALWEAETDTLEVPDAVPPEIQRNLTARKVVCTPRALFLEKAVQWPVSPGMKPQCANRYLGPNWYERLDDYKCIPKDTIVAGMHSYVGPQSDPWSCGINSIGRMMTMIGHDINDYGRFWKESPKAFSFFGHWKIGPKPRQIREHLERYVGKLSPRAGENCTDDFETHERLFHRAIELGRPSMILFQTSDTNLHWVNLVGIHHKSGNALVIDTDGHVLEWDGGRDELWRRMWITNHAACKFGFVSPYNSITCTNS